MRASVIKGSFAVLGSEPDGDSHFTPDNPDTFTTPHIAARGALGTVKFLQSQRLSGGSGIMSGMQTISVDRPKWVPVFTGLSVRQFRRLVGIVTRPGGRRTGAGRRWCLPLTDRVLLVAVYYRTILTLRQVAPLFGISKSTTPRPRRTGQRKL